MLSVAVMVSQDKRRVYSLRLPGVSERCFRGVSLAELLDDVALHLMEVIPKESMARMPRYQFCPHIELYRRRITIELPGPDKKRKHSYTGRFAVVLSRWPGEKFHIASVPTLSTQTFAVRNPTHLTAGLTRFVETYAKRHGLGTLDSATCGASDYLEILEVDTELPSILPTRPIKKKKPKKKKKQRDRSKNKKLDKRTGKKSGDSKDDDKKRKRRLIPPSTLREIGANLCHRAVDGRLQKTFGRDALVDQVLRHLDRPGAAVLLVGPSGVGKTAVINAVVQRLVGQNLRLEERTDVWAVDGNRIIAGMSMVGAWQRRCQRMVEELSARLDILYVDDLPSLVYTGRSAHSEAHVADYLEPHIARGDIRIIGECTPERLEATREEAPGFFSRFHIIQVPELGERETLGVLVSATRGLEASEQVAINVPALETVLALTRRFLPHQCHPGKGISLLRRLVADHHKVDHDEFGRRAITREHLIDFFARQTGLPRFVLWEQQARRFSAIHSHFTERIIGQPLASRAAADIVAVLQQGLNDPEKPLATMLFVGPTGVGKTETAKAMAEYLFGSKDRLVRFDMSEFRDPRSAARLFGDRFRPEGELTRRVRENPFSVVLLDEIEKAHPSIFDAFLQVFGEGRLTNAAGITADFCNTIVVMTSNLGVKQAQRNVGFGKSEASAQDRHYRSAAERFFRPEFFNRIDRIVAFRRLGRDATRPLVKRILLELLGRRGLRRSGVLVEVEPELVELLIEQGFDPRYGARSLRRALEQRLTVPLAQHLVTQPTDRTTLVQLYRHGQEIGMDVWGLQDLPVTQPPPLGYRKFAALQAGHAELTRAVTELRASEQFEALRADRTELLAAFNAGAIQPEAHSRLDSVTDVLESVNLLIDKLGEFEHHYVAPYDFVEEVERIDIGMEWEAGRPYIVGTQIPVPMARDPFFAEAAQTLVSLEEEFADVLYRGHALRGAEQYRLVRLLPATEDGDALQWNLTLGRALAGAWYHWSHTALYVRLDGAWRPAEWSEFWPDHDRDPERANRPPEALALAMRGFGIGQLVADEVGFQLSSTHRAADLICSLARVEVVAERAAEPVAVLTDLDRAFDQFRDARRRAEHVDNPRPELPIRRRLIDSRCTDPATGVELDRDSLADGLRRVCLRRILLGIEPPPSPPLGEPDHAA